MKSCSTAKESLHVSPQGEQWAVHLQTKASTKLFRTKQEAEHCAFQLAVKHRPCEVTVCEGDGVPGYRQIFGLSGDFEHPVRPPSRKLDQHGLMAYLYGLVEKHPEALVIE